MRSGVWTRHWIVVGVPEEIPTTGAFAGIAEIIRGVIDQPGLARGNAQDSVHLPAFQQLAKAFLPGKGVASLEGEAVSRVIVAVAVLSCGIGAVLRDPAETAQGAVVEAMTIRVTSSKVHTMRNPLGQSCLETIVVGTGKVRKLIDKK